MNHKSMDTTLSLCALPPLHVLVETASRNWHHCIEQLKNILRQYGLLTSGRKNELILRMEAADSMGSWIEEAAQHGNGDYEN